MGQQVTQAQCAAACGVSRQAIHKLVAAGKVPIVDGKIDLEVAKAIFSATLDPARSKIMRNAHEAVVTLPPQPVPPPAGATAVPPPETLTNYHLAKTLRENYEARRAKLNYEQEAAVLTKTADVLAAAGQLAAMIADGLDILPGRLAGVLANETDPQKREQVIEAECRLIRDEFAARVAGLAEALKDA
jgi:DNA-binding transcriptional regulator LsrR (DeoR family)